MYCLIMADHSISWNKERADEDEAQLSSNATSAEVLTKQVKHWQ